MEQTSFKLKDNCSLSLKPKNTYELPDYQE